MHHHIALAALVAAFLLPAGADAASRHHALSCGAATCKEDVFISRRNRVSIHAPEEATNCKASFYHEGTVTASGERFRPDGLTAAIWGYPFGTLLRVNYRDRSVVVRINDRGPAKWTGRCIDLSRGAARVLGFLNAGVVSVTFGKA